MMCRRWRRRWKWHEQIHDRPTIIIAHTTKGRGVSFMENQILLARQCPER